MNRMCLGGHQSFSSSSSFSYSMGRMIDYDDENEDDDEWEAKMSYRRSQATCCLSRRAWRLNNARLMPARGRL